MNAKHSLFAGLEALEPRHLLSTTPVLGALEDWQFLDVPPAGGVSVVGDVSQPGAGTIYGFTAPARGRITVELKASPSQDPVPLDTLLEVYDSQGRRIRRNNNLARGQTDSRIRMRVNEGQSYYVLAGGARGTDGAYELTLTSQARDDYGNTPQTANTVRLNRKASARRGGTVNYPGDVDMLAVTAAKTGVLHVAMSRQGRNAELECDLQATDQAGNLLGPVPESGGVASALAFEVTAGQTYCIQAAGVSGSVGRYRVVIRIDDPTPPPPPDPQPPVPQPDPQPQDDPPAALGPGEVVSVQAMNVDGLAQLLVLGTDQADTITVSRSAAGITVTSACGRQIFAGEYAGVTVYGFDGDDVIRLDHSLTVPSWVYAGAGNDTIFDAGAAGTLDAGAGDDLLVAVGGGADVLAGGEGADSFWCDSADTLTDAGRAEAAAGAVHRIAEFYQPYSIDPASAAYVSLEIAGQDLADPMPTSAARGWRNFAAAPLFVDGPRYDDIQQGYLGDCYYVASLAGYAVTDPNVIRQMIAPMGDGTYAVRFYRDGREVYLRIDADLPVLGGGALAYAGLSPQGETWVALAEKAYAYFRYDQNSYNSIQGGWMTTVYREITNLGTAVRWTSTKSAEEIYDYIAANLAAGHNVTLGSNPDAANPVVGSHAYTVLAVEKVGGDAYVTIYNPWGEDGKTYDDNPADGMLRLPAALVKDAFAAVAVSMA